MMLAHVDTTGGELRRGTEAVMVRGAAELDPATAFASARDKAEQHLRDLWKGRADQLLVDSRPFWMPEFLAAAAADSWLVRFRPEQRLQLVDRQDRQRDHGFGHSYQTTLWVAESAAAVNKGRRSLQNELQRVEQKTLITAGGTVVYWSALAMLFGWLDRLSRGYMTRRLWTIALLLASGVPAVAFLL